MNENEMFDDGAIELTTEAAIVDARFVRGPLVAERATNRVAWLIDNSEAYGKLLASLRAAQRSVHIAQLAFDADCAAYAGPSLDAIPARDTVIAETLIDLATTVGADVRILLNATWILNTARPLRKFFASRGVAAERIQVRGMARFPHFMHAKLVLVDSDEAFLLGSPFVNSYWDDGSHIPFDARRPLRELGGRPLHDVSLHLRGPVVSDLEAMFANLWSACGETEPATRRRGLVAPPSSPMQRAPGVRVVCDAPDDILPGSQNGSMHMLSELLEGISRARSFIYVEHQYLTSRPIVDALVDALHRAPALEIIIVLNQNPDLTAYRAWQNLQLDEHALLHHPRVGVFTLWSTGVHPERAGATRGQKRRGECRHRCRGCERRRRRVDRDPSRAVVERTPRCLTRRARCWRARWMAGNVAGRGSRECVHALGRCGSHPLRSSHGRAPAAVQRLRVSAATARGHRRRDRSRATRALLQPHVVQRASEPALDPQHLLAAACYSLSW